MSIDRSPKAVQEVGLKWFKQSPFFYNFLQNFVYHEDEKVGTIGVYISNEKIHLYICPSFFNNLSFAQREGALIHEILHLVHLTQKREVSKYTIHELFNIASDVCINERIIQSEINNGRCELPIFDQLWHLKTLNERAGKKYTGALLTEEIYEFLKENEEAIEEYLKGGSSFDDVDGEGSSSSAYGNGEGADGDSTGKGGNGSANAEDGEDGEGNGSADGKGKEGKSGKGSANGKSGDGEGDLFKDSKIERGCFDNHTYINRQKINENAKAIIDNIVRESVSKGFGTMSGGLKDFIENCLKSKLNWTTLLRRYLKSSTAKGMIKKLSWEKANRRNLPLMGKKKISTEYIVALDTSGSLSKKDLSEFFGEVEKIIANGKVHLLMCDTKLYDKGAYHKGDWKKLSVDGRGGTELSPIFEYVKENKLTKAKVIVFTDGYFDHRAIASVGRGIDTIWVLQSGCKENAKYLEKIAGHKVVNMPDENERRN